MSVPSAAIVCRTVVVLAYLLALLAAGRPGWGGAPGRAGRGTRHGRAGAGGGVARSPRRRLRPAPGPAAGGSARSARGGSRRLSGSGELGDGLDAEPDAEEEEERGGAVGDRLLGQPLAQGHADDD